MVTEQQIEYVRKFLTELLTDFVLAGIQVISERSGDCSFYASVDRSLDVGDEDRLDKAMDGLVSVIPYIPDISATFVFLLHRKSMIYSWTNVGHSAE